MQLSTLYESKYYKTYIYFKVKDIINDGFTDVLKKKKEIHDSLVGHLGQLNKGRLLMCFWPCFIDIQ